jgi:hypothetical protein
MVMPTSASSSTTGDEVDVVGVVVGDTVSTEAGIVERAVVATAGIDALMETTDGTAISGAPYEVGATGGGAAALETHSVVRNTKTTSHRPRCRNDCDFTLSPHRTVLARAVGGERSDLWR